MRALNGKLFSHTSGGDYYGRESTARSRRAIGTMAFMANFFGPVMPVPQLTEPAGPEISSAIINANTNISKKILTYENSGE